MLFRQSLEKIVRNKVLLVFLVIFITGFYLRASVAYTTELWGDESVSVETVTVSSFKDLVIQSGGYEDILHPTGYYILLKLWLFLGFFDDNWIRTLTLLFYLPTVVLLYLLGKELTFEKKTSLFSIFIFSIHPLLVNLGYQARMYAPALFSCIVCLYFLFKKNDSKKEVVLSALFLAIGIYIDYLTLWLVGALICVLLLKFISSPVFCRKLAKVLALTALLSLPQLIVLTLDYFQVGGMIDPGSIPQGKITAEYFLIETGQLFGLFWDETYITALFLGLGIGLIFYRGMYVHSSSLRIIILIIITLSLLFSYIKSPIYLARNLSIVSVVSCFVISEGFYAALKKKQFALVLLIIMYMAHLIFVSVTRKGFLFQNDLALFSQKIKSENALVIFLSDSVSPTLTAFYFPKAGVENHQVLHLKRDFNSTDLNIFSTPRKKYVVHATTCLSDDICKSQHQEVKKICALKGNNCEIFKEL